MYEGHHSVSAFDAVRCGFSQPNPNSLVVQDLPRTLAQIAFKAPCLLGTLHETRDEMGEFLLSLLLRPDKI